MAHDREDKTTRGGKAAIIVGGAILVVGAAALWIAKAICTWWYPAGLVYIPF